MPKFIISNGESGVRGIDLRWATGIGLALCAAIVALTTERVTVLHDLSRVVTEWNEHKRNEDLWTVHITPSEHALFQQSMKDQEVILDDLALIKRKLNISGNGRDGR